MKNNAVVENHTRTLTDIPMFRILVNSLLKGIVSRDGLSTETIGV
jgi:hypothetical protein